MKNNYLPFFLYFILSLITVTRSLHAQDSVVEITGKIDDKDSKEPLIGANVSIKGTVNGTVTDANGDFVLRTKYKFPFTLVIAYMGYQTQEFEITSNTKSLNIALNTSTSIADEVVVTASRVEEKIQRSPVAIEKLDIRTIKESPAPSFYDAIENVKGVQMTTASITFKIPNTRGFNVPNNFRFMQLIDGVDNQSATLGVPLGNAIGPTELDIESVEITPGAASALYGMNAINGMSNLLTKSPFKYQGLSVYQRTAVNHVDGIDHAPAPLTETAFRYAKAFNNRLAFKVNVSYLQGIDWYANNTTLFDVNNRATNDNTNINPGYPQLAGPNGIAVDPVNSYGNESNMGVTITDKNGKTYSVRRTGYAEKDLVNYKVQNLKLDGAIHYRISEKLEASYSYRYGQMDGNFQRGNRIALRGASVQNHKVELKGDKFFIRAYTSIENTGNSYNIKPLADNLELSFKDNTRWAADYTSALNAAENQGKDLVTANQIARAAADQGRFIPGTSEFNAQVNLIKHTNNWDVGPNPANGNSGVAGAPPSGGAALWQRSRFYHAETQYDLSSKIKIFDLLVGADYRTYQIIPDGNNFVDFSKPISERTTPGGKDVYYTKVGGFAQITKRLLQDKLKLVGSLRYDKNLDFKHRLNPRVAAVYTLAQNHNFRVSYQNGFRFPSLFEAFSFVNNGSVRRVGGLAGVNNGFGFLQNSYTGNSINLYRTAVQNDINAGYSRQQAGERNAGLLQKANLSPIQPERINSFEAGYKSVVLNNKLVIDLDGYFNYYDGFIGQLDVSTPNSGNINGSDAAQTQLDMMNNNSVTRFRVWTNAKARVYNYGSSLGLTYNFFKKYTVGGNVNYNAFDNRGSKDPLIPGFNTPKYFTNISFGNKEIVKNLGFNIVWRWQESFLWQNLFGDGIVPSYNTFDAQVNYRLTKINTTVKVGGSNILNHRYIQYIGGPTVGGMYYVTLTVDGLLNPKAKKTITETGTN